jgi:WD40 repeat protein/uncharacterized membrane protein YhaH (DUF805 family)
MSDEPTPLPPTPGSASGGGAQFEDLSLFGYWLKCLKNYADFRGRARRKEFWGFYLFNAIAGVAFVLGGVFLLNLSYRMGIVPYNMLEPLDTAVELFWPLATLLPGLAAFARRLHDVGKSGWHCLWPLIPVVGVPMSLVALYWLCKGGDPGENEHGPAPCFRTASEGGARPTWRVAAIIAAALLGLALIGFIVFRPSEPSESLGEHAPFVGHADAVTSVAFSPDGASIASGSYDDTIKLWDAATGKETAAFIGHADVVNSVAFAPNGASIASGSNDGTVRLWDVATGREIAAFTGHADGVNTVAFAPDGLTIASGSNDGTIRLWDVATGLEARSFGGNGSLVESLAWSPDGGRVASGHFSDFVSSGNTIGLWEATSGRGMKIFSSKGYGANVMSLAFSPDGSQLLTGALDNSARLWDVSPGGDLTEAMAFAGQKGGNIQSVAFNPDGKRIATGSGWAVFTVKVWDISTGAEIVAFTGHRNTVLSLAFSPDGKRLASGSADGTVKVWEL